MNKQIDSGPTYLKKELELNGTRKKFSRAGIVIEKMIKEILALNPKPKNQDGEPYFLKRRKPNKVILKNLTIGRLLRFYKDADRDGYPKVFLKQTFKV